MSDKPAADEATGPTPGEMLLRALRAQWLLWRLQDEGATAPAALDIEAVAQTLGIASAVEHFQEGEFEDEGVLFLHLPAEVLVIDHTQEFPWRLLDVFAWGRRQEWRDLWRRTA